MLTDVDSVLLDRIRPMIKRRKGVTERRMFGGVCFFINGNMCVETWKGSLVVRLDKEKHDETQAERHAKPMDITGKVKKGWSLVQPTGIKSDEDLTLWVARAAKFASSSPAKS
jgi:TfoX/Sxy family transcriptional regulator of competence genes